MARRTRRLLAALALCACACNRDPAPTPKPTPSSAPAPAASASTPPATPAKPRLACRALSVEGRVVLDGGQTLASSDPIDGRTWLELEKGAKLAIRHAVSGRELSLSGPASVLPCVAGEEEFLLAHGTIRGSHGLGARPGAEVLLATPLGNVRYADAALELRLSGKKLEVDVRTGSARLDPAKQSHLTGKRELGPRSKASVSGRPDPAALVKECEAKAKVAGERARAVLAPNTEGPSLGERAAAHVEARRQARGACMTAAAATALAEQAERAPLRARVAAAERLWKAIPAQIPPAKP